MAGAAASPIGRRQSRLLRRFSEALTKLNPRKAALDISRTQSAPAILETSHELHNGQRGSLLAPNSVPLASASSPTPEGAVSSITPEGSPPTPKQEDSSDTRAQASRSGRAGGSGVAPAPTGGEQSSFLQRASKALLHRFSRNSAQIEQRAASPATTQEGSHHSLNNRVGLHEVSNPAQAAQSGVPPLQTMLSLNEKVRNDNEIDTPTSHSAHGASPLLRLESRGEATTSLDPATPTAATSASDTAPTAQQAALAETQKYLMQWEQDHPVDKEKIVAALKLVAQGHDEKKGIDINNPKYSEAMVLFRQGLGINDETWKGVKKAIGRQGLVDNLDVIPAMMLMGPVSAGLGPLADGMGSAGTKVLKYLNLFLLNVGLTAASQIYADAIQSKMVSSNDGVPVTAPDIESSEKFWAFPGKAKEEIKKFQALCQDLESTSLNSSEREEKIKQMESLVKTMDFLHAGYQKRVSRGLQNLIKYESQIPARVVLTPGVAAMGFHLGPLGLWGGLSAQYLLLVPLVFRDEIRLKTHILRSNAKYADVLTEAAKAAGITRESPDLRPEHIDEEKLRKLWAHPVDVLHDNVKMVYSDRIATLMRKERILNKKLAAYAVSSSLINKALPDAIRAKLEKRWAAKLSNTRRKVEALRSDISKFEEGIGEINRGQADGNAWSGLSEKGLIASMLTSPAKYYSLVGRARLRKLNEFRAQVVERLTTRGVIGTMSASADIAELEKDDSKSVLATSLTQIGYAVNSVFLNPLAKFIKQTVVRLLGIPRFNEAAAGENNAAVESHPVAEAGVAGGLSPADDANKIPRKKLLFGKGAQVYSPIVDIGNGIKVDIGMTRAYYQETHGRGYRFKNIITHTVRGAWAHVSSAVVQPAINARAAWSDRKLKQSLKAGKEILKTSTRPGAPPRDTTHNTPEAQADNTRLGAPETQADDTRHNALGEQANEAVHSAPEAPPKPSVDQASELQPENQESRSSTPAIQPANTSYMEAVMREIQVAPDSRPASLTDVPVIAGKSAETIEQPAGGSSVSPPPLKDDAAPAVQPSPPRAAGTPSRPAQGWSSLATRRTPPPASPAPPADLTRFAPDLPKLKPHEIKQKLVAKQQHLYALEETQRRNENGPGDRVAPVNGASLKDLRQKFLWYPSDLNTYHDTVVMVYTDELATLLEKEKDLSKKIASAEKPAFSLQLRTSSDREIKRASREKELAATREKIETLKKDIVVFQQGVKAIRDGDGDMSHWGDLSSNGTIATMLADADQHQILVRQALKKVTFSSSSEYLARALEGNGGSALLRGVAQSGGVVGTQAAPNASNDTALGRGNDITSGIVTLSDGSAVNIRHTPSFRSGGRSAAGGFAASFNDASSRFLRQIKPSATLTARESVAASANHPLHNAPANNEPASNEGSGERPSARSR